MGESDLAIELAEATAKPEHGGLAHGGEHLAGRKTGLDWALECATGIVLLGDVVVVGMQVVSRLLMQRPIPWTEEIARVLMIWVMLFGGVVALRRGQHTRITAGIRMLKRETVEAVELGINLVVFGFFGVLAYQAYSLVLVSVKELLPASEITGAFVTGPMPLCLLLMMWYLLQDIIRDAREVSKSSRAIALAVATTVAAFGSVAFPLLAGVPPVAVLVIGFLVTGALGMPIGFALALVSFTYLLSLPRVSLTILPIKIIGGVDSFPLLAIPLFILGGALMETGGISQRIVNFAKAMVGHLRGGLPMGTIVAEMLFSGISGSTTADVSAMTSLMVPSMKRAGYPGEDAVSIVSAASALGMLVPPCLTMVVLGSLANLSIVTLFIAGFVPGVVLALWVALVVYLRARRFGWPLERRATFKEFLLTTRAAMVPMGTPIIIFGGIFSGWVTVTEAALIAVLYALIVGVLLYKEISWTQLPEMFVNSGVVTAMTLWVLGAASVFAWILAREQVPQFVASWFTSGEHGWVVFMAVTLAIFVVIGALLEGLPVLLIFGPIFIPIAINLHIDPIHYGTVIVACMGIAFFLPPVGVGLYIACGIGKVDLNRTIPVYMPYLAALIVGLIFIAYVPEFSLVLPRWILGYGVK
jgi:tripartite ATP-independent transporter DctM subunit